MDRLILFLFVVAGLAIGSLSAQETAQPAGDEAAIRQTVESYRAAFNKGDAKALADHWSDNAVYTNRFTGEEAIGRAAIAEEFAAIFKEKKGLKLDVSIESLRLLSPSVAVEHGTAKLLAPQAEPEETKYTAIYVKQGDKWLLDRVTDGTDDSPPSHYEQLKALEWMVGSWIDEDKEARIETECNWTKNRNFLTRSYSIVVGDQIEMSGMQIIGWDPAAKTIRSWTFDSDGGFSEGTWTYKKDRWHIRTSGVLADGRKASAVNIMKPVDANSFTWQTTERTAGGELLPSVDEVLIVRK
ncbi:MAG TPA: SgcJ/EcaC family oxidoreductase [Pirellulaceae bacterium]|nr:SgcJ/EcaC family oxidoreductase [Pirellulaceae bacterium]